MSAARTPQPRVRRKSPNGEGSVFPVTVRGKRRWKAQVSLGRTPAGKRRYATRTATSEQQARKLLRSMLTERDKGRLAQRTRHTVTTYGLHWARDIKPSQVRPTTAAHYEDMLRRYVFPHIGSLALVDLRAHHVQQLLTTLTGHGLSANTINRARTALRGALEHAVAMDVIAHNPVTATKPVKNAPHARGRAATPWTPEEASTALERIGTDPVIGCYVTVALTTGFRPGELLGLRWADVDLDLDQIHVTGTLKQARLLLPDGSGTVRLQRNEPKTRASARTLPLTPLARAALTRHREHQRFREVIAQDTWQDTGYVFTTQHGTPYNSSNFRRIFQRALTAAGIRPVRLHSLRHSVARLGLEAGGNIEEISQALGHTRIDTTKQIYAGFIPHLNDQFATRLQRHYNTLRTPTPHPTPDTAT
jgi:integrase